MAVVRRGIAQTLFDMMQQQAISNVRLIREPTAVTVKFDTVHATFATLELFHMVHGEVDLDIEKENLVGVRVELFGNAQDQHAIFFSGLEQERRYWYRISVPRRSPAEPAADGHVRARGEFATLRRDTFVDIEQLHVIDDSDSTSGGDLRFSYALYDASAPGHPRLIEPRFTGEFSRDSGEDIDGPFGAGINIGRAPDRMGVYVDGQDDDTNAWAGPWQGRPIVGMRPPAAMPDEMSSFSNIGFDGSDALGLFILKRFLGRHSVPFDIGSAQGALHYSVRGRFITEVSDTLGPRAVPPWKKVRRAKARLDPKGRSAGMAALPDGLLGLALLPDGSLQRQAAGPRGTWAALEAPAMGELLVQPVAAGGLLLVGLDREGRPQLATLADPRADVPRWRTLKVTAAATPVVVDGRDGIVHLLVTDPRGGLWHTRADADAGKLAQVAKRVAPRPPVAAVDPDGRLVAAFADAAGALRVITIGRDGQIERGDGPDGDLRIPLAIVADGERLLLAAVDAEDRVAVRTLGDSATEWEVLGALDALLEGPIEAIEPIPLERLERTAR